MAFQVPIMGLVRIIDHWSSPIYLLRVCSCIPCGHVYGRSCREKLLRPSGKESAKVPWVILYILDEQIELNCSTYAWILYFLTSALSVAKDLWRSLLWSSTHQKTYVRGLLQSRGPVSFSHCTSPLRCFEFIFIATHIRCRTQIYLSRSIYEVQI